MEKPTYVLLEELFSKEMLQKLMESKLGATITDWGSDRIVDLRSKDSTVKEQFGGTCSCFATIAAIENKLGGKIDLAEHFLWNLYQIYSTDAAINAAMKNYIVEEQFWPNYPEKARYKISKINTLENNYLEVIRAIDNGNPCIVALATPEDLAEGKKQVEATSKVSKKSGHALCVSGYKVENGKGYFLVKNSWGETYGDKGYQYIAFNLYDTTPYIYFWEVLSIDDRGAQVI